MLNALDKIGNKKRHLTLKEKALFLSLLTLLFLALLVPVVQAARSRQLIVQRRGIEKELQRLEEERRIILSLIAEASLPEVISEKAANNNLLLEKILGENIKVVTIKE
ncbi:MAG: hypothetical protein GX842_02405 [Spirochaetales bacterium]|nr:hypothetical protein [Spirochaetales bacterium]